MRANGVAFEYLNLRSSPRLLQAFLNLEDEDIWHVMSANRMVLALAAVGLIFARHPAIWAAFVAAAVCMLYGAMPYWLTKNPAVSIILVR